MTDEYFYIEEISHNSSEIESEKSTNNKKCLKAMERNDHCLSPTDKQSQEIRLHEIEQQLEMAESRCNNLKGQVDYMKMLYNGMNGKENKGKPKLPQPAAARRHLTIDSGRKRNGTDGSLEKVNKYTEERPSRERDVEFHQYPTNQTKSNSSNISTIPQRDRGERIAPNDRRTCEKDANAAVKSINNIITGITNSVNRLTQLQVQIGNNQNISNIDDPMGIQNVKCSPRYQDSNTAAEKPYQTEESTNTDKKFSSDSIKSKSLKKRRRLKGKTASKQSMASNSEKKRIRVTAKHIEKRTRLSSQACTGDISQLTVNKVKKRQFGKLRTISSRTLLMKRSAYTSKTVASKQEKQEWKSDKLIELYHNSAVKIITPSEDSIHNKKAVSKLPPEPIKPRVSHHNNTTATLPTFEKPENNLPVPNVPQYRPPLSPINEGEIQYGGSYYRNNYELPTIASKMKQVAKSYFQNFSFRTIPFVAAKSITPSHNLGVNIQQVLSIIKGRKPVAGISPTLAYNIELAANKLGSRPLSALVSNLGSRMNSNKTMCPLARRYPFSHLQEMAKEIPEETIDEINAAYDEETPKIIPPHLLAAGDKDVENNPEEKIWYSDTKKSGEKCTCMPKPGVSFNDVYTKYAEDKMNRGRNINPAKRIRHRPWNENRRVKPIPLAEVITQPVGSRCSQINNRERTLKEVLTNLHDEFACLNDRYDELKSEVANVKGSNSNLVIEIEKMEKDLQNKEDEITMVMSLYKEVMALKQQVKMLKTRASQSTVVVSPFINRNRDFKDLNAAGHLTKLLRHIQQFQETLKNKTR